MATPGASQPYQPLALPAGASPEQRRAIDDLFSLTYEELRRLAARVRQQDARATITPTALVNEAWMKLRDSRALPTISALHFKHLAARAMRQVLVEAARRRRAHKRGGGLPPVTFDEELMSPSAGAAGVLALDAALESLPP